MCFCRKHKKGKHKKKSSENGTAKSKDKRNKSKSKDDLVLNGSKGIEKADSDSQSEGKPVLIDDDSDSIEITALEEEMNLEDLMRQKVGSQLLELLLLLVVIRLSNNQWPRLVDFVANGLDFTIGNYHTVEALKSNHDNVIIILPI